MYLEKNDKVWTSATLATLQPIYLWKSYISFKMTKSEHPEPSQPSQPIYLWKWYVSLKKWPSLNIRNPRNLFIFENDIYLWKWQSLNIRNPPTLATYLFLKMICIFKKITKSEHPQPSQPLHPIYFWKWYLSLKKWQSLNNRNPRNPRNLFIFENDMYL